MGFKFIILCVSVCLGTLSESSEVPLVVWNHIGSLMDIKPISAFEKNVDGVIKQLSETSSKDAYVLVFMMDHLSLEDFSDESESANKVLKALQPSFEAKPHMLMSAVKDPMKHLEKLPCQAKEIFLGKSGNRKLSKEVMSSLEQSCVVVVHLPDTYHTANNHVKDLQELLATLESSEKNIVGLLTGEKASWLPPGDLKRRGRSLLAEAKIKDDHFFNMTCAIMYIENVTLIVGNNLNDSSTMHFPPKTEVSCGNSTVITLEFTGPESSTLHVTLNFEAAARSWFMANATVKASAGKQTFDELDFKSQSLLEAPLGFSYSCGDWVLKPKNSTFQLMIIFQGFQVQPYRVVGAFASSFNCVPWFTLPILMGILVAILFIIILNAGIYALFNIKTMDRFDDPKGKTISVPTGNE